MEELTHILWLVQVKVVDDHYHTSDEHPMARAAPRDASNIALHAHFLQHLINKKSTVKISSY